VLRIVRSVTRVRFFQTVPLSAGDRAIPYVFQPWSLDEAGIETNTGDDASAESLDLQTTHKQMVEFGL
jgi:hypothetical protein